MLVVDASTVAGWFLPDEDGPDPATLLAPEERAAAPWLLWAEIRNILLVNERRGRLSSETAGRALAAVEALGIALDATPSSAGVLALARRHGLTVYDALYLELALREGGRLATRDAALRRAAEAEGVAAV